MKSKCMFLTFMLLILNVGALFAQARKVSGTVTDTDSQTPLPGATIMVKGTTIGTVTDGDGKYTIDVKTDEDVLIFNFLGMQSVEQKVGARNVINVNMITDALEINEVVVTAMGIERKAKSLTYAT
ncbi:MAG: carboxypeptidase-like regulatory domain-containing protein, partial [Tannerellaceae bacterium]